MDNSIDPNEIYQIKPVPDGCTQAAAIQWLQNQYRIQKVQVEQAYKSGKTSKSSSAQLSRESSNDFTAAGKKFKSSEANAMDAETKFEDKNKFAELQTEVDELSDDEVENTEPTEVHFDFDADSFLSAITEKYKELTPPFVSADKPTTKTLKVMLANIYQMVGNLTKAVTKGIQQNVALSQENQILRTEIQSLQNEFKQHVESTALFQKQIQYQTSTLQNTTAKIQMHQCNPTLASTLRSRLIPSQTFNNQAKNYIGVSPLNTSESTHTQQQHSPTTNGSFSTNIPTSTAQIQPHHNRVCPNNSTDTHACPNNSTDTHAHPHTPAPTPAKSESLYALQICTLQPFKTTPDLKNKFLRALQTKNNLPPINEVFPMKHTVDQFRLRFENVLQRESWLLFFNENTHLLKSFQSVNLHRTKITLKGIPKQALQHGSKPLIDSLCNQLKLPPQDFYFLFSFEEKKSPDFLVAVLLVSPLVRRCFFKHNDGIFLQEMNLALEINDFHQPRLCTLCGKIGHSKSKCTLNEGCIHCGTSNCCTKSAHCQRKHCLNCLQTDHDTFDRDSCPAIKDSLHHSIDNLCVILAEPFHDHTSDQLFKQPPIIQTDTSTQHNDSEISEEKLNTADVSEEKSNTNAFSTEDHMD
jgi:regulator of replication initiation timing